MNDINLSFNYAFRGKNNYFSSGISFLLYQTENPPVSNWDIF